MARLPTRVASTGTPLPPDWRPATWRISAMLGKMPTAEYEPQWQAFATAMRGQVSDDWTGDWRRWCRAYLTRHAEAQRAAAGGGLFGGLL